MATALRPALLALAVLAATAAAAPVPKCIWAVGTCNASPGHLLSVMDNLRPASPQGEGMLHVYALEASCHARADKKGCEDALFCLWDTKTYPKCSANLEKLNGVLSDMTTITGCPGSLSATLAPCNAIKFADACNAKPECGWLTPENIPVSEGRTEAGARKRFVRRKLSVAVSPMMRHNTSADNYEEIVMGPFEKALAGCQPAKLAELAKANKVKELEKLIGRIDEQEEDVYGACEQEPFKQMQRCLAATDARTCTEHSECAWDPDGSECFAAQHVMVSSLLGDNTRAATAAKVCHAFPNAIACKAAGSVEFEQRTVEALLPDAKAVKLALAAEGDDKAGYQPFSLED